MLKLKIVSLRDDVAAWSSWLRIKAVCQSVREATASGVDNAASPTCEHRWTGLFHLREADHYAKTTGRNQSILMSSADKFAHIDGQLVCMKQYTRFNGKYKYPKVIKPSNPFTDVCWVSVLTTFSAPPQVLAASTVFSSAQFQKRRNDGWWFPLCYCCRFVLNSKRLLSTSCNKQGRQVASSIFMVLFPVMLTLKFAESYVWKLNEALNNELKFHIVNIY